MPRDAPTWLHGLLPGILLVVEGKKHPNPEKMVES